MENQQRGVDQQQREAERQQERRQNRSAHDEVDHETLHEISEDVEDHERDRYAEERIDVIVREQHVGQVSPQHHERTVREIDDVHDAPHEAEAERHQSQDPTGQDSVDEILQE